MSNADPIAALIEAWNQRQNPQGSLVELAAANAAIWSALYAAMPAIVAMAWEVGTLKDKLAESEKYRKQRLYEVERLRAELAECMRSKDHAVDLLTGIHSLLYPAPIKTPDGRTMVFRPKSIDPNEVLQELSDRIRALPDALAQQKGKEEST